MPELREVFEMTTKQAEPDVDSWREQEQRQRKSTRNKKLGAFAVAAAIALVAAVVVITSTGDDTKVVPATSPSKVITTPPTGAFFLDLSTGEVTPLPDNLADAFIYSVSPDGTRIFTNECCSGLDVAMVANIDGTDAREIDSAKGLEYYGGNFSPDGTKLIYQERSGVGIDVGNLFVEDLDSGKRTKVTDIKLQSAYWWFLSPTFSPDGQKVVFQLPRSSSEITKWDVWSVPLTGGEPALVLRNAAQPIYAPDGSGAFIEPASNSFFGPRIMLTTADGPQMLVEAKESIDFPTFSPDSGRIAYGDGGSIYVVDVSTGESSKVADGGQAAWVDDSTLIVRPDEP
jgi:hypothetical protein